MHRRTAWPLLFLLLALAGTVWQLAQSEPEVEQAPEPEPLERVVTEPAALVVPPASEVVDSGVTPLEVVVPVVDAGASTFTTQPPAGFDVEAYVAKWRAALAPLLKRTAMTKSITTREADRGSSAAPPTDAGVASCEARRLTLDFHESARVDLFVFIDTSGSMYGVLPAVAQWLGELEFALREAQRDFQLIVVANTDWLLRTERIRLDAGVIKQRINSNDIVEVVLASGASPGVWRSFARPEVPTEFVLVTDDSPYGQPSYEARFEALMGASLAQTRVHVMGGFDVGSANLLGPEAPLAPAVCRPHGVSHGLEYQRLSMAYRGSRTSLCRTDSWSALKDVLLKTPVRPEARCSWQFELHPDAVLGPPLALPASGLPVSLIREKILDDCGSGFRRSYLSDQRSITLCPATCVALPEDGFRGLEFSWRCP